MSATAVFAIGFVALMAVTLLVPSFPPAQLLYENLKIQPSTLSIWGIPVASLLNGITNGFFWVTIIAIVYSLSRYTRKSKPLPPMPVAPQLRAPLPEPMLVDPRVNVIPPALTVPPVSERKNSLQVLAREEPIHRERKVSTWDAIKKGPVGMGQDIETIEGIGPICSGLLRNSGINTVNDLLKVGAKESGRQFLANEVGVSYATLLKWIYRGDLSRVKGVGTKYAVLLESAGVNTVTELSARTPHYLAQTLRKVNREKNLVRRAPPQKTIEMWVNNARELKPIVE